jgi:hypothetical protein
MKNKEIKQELFEVFENCNSKILGISAAFYKKYVYQSSKG